MTGFLQRLAERATAVTPPVRAVSTASFVPIPFLTEQALPLADIDTMLRAAPPVPGTVMIPQTLVEPQKDMGATAEHDHRLGVLTMGVEQTASPRKTAHTSAASSSLVEPVVGRSRSELPPTPIALAEDTAPPLSLATDPGAGRQLQQLDETSSRRPSLTQPIPAPIARVEPLLPPAGKLAEAVRPAMSLDKQERGKASMIEETTEIHVSIGRIEVMAIHEPAPSKPAACRRKAPMSLDEYLAGRQGGRP